MLETVIGTTPGCRAIKSFFCGICHNGIGALYKEVMTVFQTLLTRLRIDQTVGLWWRVETILVLLQIVFMIFMRGYP